jgi:hypothetical protein
LWIVCEKRIYQPWRTTMTASRIDGIPVINQESPREDLMVYIRALEARLQIDHVFKLQEDENGERERLELDQDDRVSLLVGEADKVGCQAETIAHLDQQNDLLREHRNSLLGAMAAIEALAFEHPENKVIANLGKIAAGALEFHRDHAGEDPRAAGWLQGFAAARDVLASIRTPAGGIDLPVSAEAAQDALESSIRAQAARGHMAEPDAPIEISRDTVRMALDLAMATLRGDMATGLRRTLESLEAQASEPALPESAPEPAAVLA